MGHATTVLWVALFSALTGTLVPTGAGALACSALADPVAGAHHVPWHQQDAPICTVAATTCTGVLVFTWTGLQDLVEVSTPSCSGTVVKVWSAAVDAPKKVFVPLTTAGMRYFISTEAGNCADHNMLVSVSTTCGAAPSSNKDAPALGSCRPQPDVTPSGVARVAWHESEVPLCEVFAACGQVLQFNATYRQSVVEVSSHSCSARVIQTWSAETDGPLLTRVSLNQNGLRYFMSTVPGHCSTHNMLLTVSTTCTSDKDTVVIAMQPPPPPSLVGCRALPAVTPSGVLRVAWHASVIPFCQARAQCGQMLVFNATDRQSVTEVASLSCTARVLQTWAAEADGPTLTRVLLNAPGMRYFMTTVTGLCNVRNMILPVNTASCGIASASSPPQGALCRANAPVTPTGVAHVYWHESTSPLCDIVAACGYQVLFTFAGTQDLVEISSHSCSANVIQTWATPSDSLQAVAVPLFTAGVRYFMSSVAGHCGPHNMLLTVRTTCLG